MLRIEEFSTNLDALVGSEPNFNQSHVSGRVGVAFRLLSFPLYDTGFVSREWR